MNVGWIGFILSVKQSMSAQKPTRGQVERTLKQRIQALYFAELGQRPQQVICQFFDDKLAIVIESSVTRSEHFLLTTAREDLAKELRSHIDTAIKPQLTVLIEEVTGIAVNALLADTDLKRNTSGVIAILADVPQLRDVETIPKVKRKKCLSNVGL